MFFALLLCCVLSVLSSSIRAETVETKFGKLRGDVRGHFIAFEGIPYAQPPVGELRFQPPKELEAPWKEVRDAIKPGSKCVQYNRKENKAVGDEDCLFLNVYVPKERTEEKLPIVFFIHGGGFTDGEGVEDGPELLMHRKVILVTLNYRLGALGFLSTGDEVLPGNMGMKDQAMALKWIHENAEAFHGNKDKITISGWSAGALSIQLHFMSPLSTPYFDRGISHSSVYDIRWLFIEKPHEIFDQVAEILQCKHESRQESKDCIHKAPVADLAKLSIQFPRFLAITSTPFGPVAEKNEQGAFMPSHPKETIKSGSFAKKPWIVSMTDEEGLLLGAEMLKNEEKFKELEEKWVEICPKFFRLEDKVPKEKWEETCIEIRKKYFGEKAISKDTLLGFIRMMSDRFSTWGTPLNLKLYYEKLPVYFYEYKFKPDYGKADKLLGRRTELPGCAHGDDLFSIFHDKEREECCPLTDKEKKMSEVMTKMYEEFAHGGEPKIGDVKIPRIDSATNIKYLKVESPDKIEEAVMDPKTYGNAEFWERILLPQKN